MKRQLLSSLFLAVLLAVGSAFAATTGKITGSVVDAQSKEPLLGVSVQIVGTTLGAVTDVNGTYNILNVPVGTYTLKFSSVGFSSLEISNVTVSVDLASYHDARLSSAATDIGKVVQVTAEQPLIIKDKTSSINVIRKEELAALPVRGTQEVVAIQNSVVKTRAFNANSTRGDREAINGSELNIRGGRPSDVAYFVDGFPIQDPLTGITTLEVIPGSIKEYAVIAGGFPAEYGFVSSGVVNIITTSGQEKYEGQIEASSDNLSGDNFDQNFYTASLSGPIPGTDKGYFFGGLMRKYEGDRSPSAISKSMFTGGQNRLPNNASGSWAYQGKLDYNFTPKIKFNLQGFGSRNEWREYRHSYFFNQAHIPYYDDENFSLNSRLTVTLDEKSYFNLSGSFMDIERFRGDGVHRRNLTDYSLSANPAFDPTALFLTGDLDTTYVTVDSLGDTTFTTRDEGSVFDDYLKRRSSYLLVKGDFNTVLGDIHTVKLGFEAQRHTIRYYNHLFPVQIGVNSNFEDLDRYGYDSLGNEIDGGDDRLGLDGPKKPINLALYLQDRFEWRGLIINGGLRFDYFDYRAKQIRNPERPFDPDNKGLTDTLASILDESDLKESEKFSRVSPRFGISFPVSEKTQLRLNYGKFYQRPELQRLFIGYRYYEAKVNKGGYYYPIGNPSLAPEKTTAYEVGIDHQIGQYSVVQLAFYYRDVIDQVQVYSQSAQPTQYASYRNSDYGTVKGFEFRLKMKRVNNVELDANYTLQFANGTGSYTNTLRNIAWTSARAPKQTAPLDYDQRHKLTGVLTWSTRENEGPRWGKNHPLENVNLTFLVQANSGKPYSPQEVYNEVTLAAVTPEPRAPRNSSYGPWNFTIDLKLQKSFGFGAVELTPYFVVRNLLDNENVNTVYESTGQADNTSWLSTEAGQEFASTFASENRYGLTGTEMYNLKQNDPLNYDAPRQFFLGIAMSF